MKRHRKRGDGDVEGREGGISGCHAKAAAPGRGRRRRSSLGEHRREIPLKVDVWPEAYPKEPGHVEVDSVAHCGGSTAGSFVWTVTMTDVATHRTELRAVWNKGTADVGVASRRRRKQGEGTRPDRAERHHGPSGTDGRRPEVLGSQIVGRPLGGNFGRLGSPASSVKSEGAGCRFIYQASNENDTEFRCRFHLTQRGSRSPQKEMAGLA